MAFIHVACFYRGLDEFMDVALPFLHEGLRGDEPMLVAVDAGKIACLRDALGAEAERVAFADMATLGANPARIIPAWHDVVASRAPGAAVRGIGEPIWPGRGEHELVECHRHEQLLNVAFADASGFRLLCPYDTAALHPDVLAHARHTHPGVVEHGTHRDSADWPGLDEAARPFGEPLSAPPASAGEVGFGAENLSKVRRCVLGFARREGMTEEPAADLALAVHELAANSVRHGGGRGVLRYWCESEVVVCEVCDAGRMTEPLLGRVRPAPGQTCGYGLWLANQLCDLVQVRCFADGGTVRVRLAL